MKTHPQVNLSGWLAFRTPAREAPAPGKPAGFTPGPRPAGSRPAGSRLAGSRPAIPSSSHVSISGKASAPSPLLPLSLSGAALLFVLLSSGCGTPGAPQPPSLKLPQPPTDFAAIRSGDAVSLHWTMPRRATDRVLLAGDQRAVICRAAGAVACMPIATLLLQAGAPASYIDVLPAALTAGPPHLLRYTVLLQNRQHTEAGPSNMASTAAGAAPPPVMGLQATASAQGITLHWQPAGPGTLNGTQPNPVEHLLRLHRTRVPQPGENTAPPRGETQAGVPQPEEQTLELGSHDPQPGPTMASGWTGNDATDADALLNRTYRYTVERVARVRLDGHPVEVTSGPSAPANVHARDLFPPAVPSGVEAVADAQGAAIDISWTPDAEADLAGYAVFRRVAGAGEPMRISGVAPVADPAWRDATVQPGVHYAYSVSAVDTSGNESARSPEAAETMRPYVEQQPQEPQPKVRAKKPPHVKV